MTQGKTGYWFRSLKVRPGGDTFQRKGTVNPNSGKFQCWCLCSSQVRGILTRDGVEEDEVLEVGDLPSLPALSHVGRFEKLLGCGKRDAPV